MPLGALIARPHKRRRRDNEARPEVPGANREPGQPDAANPQSPRIVANEQGHRLRAFMAAEDWQLAAQSLRRAEANLRRAERAGGLFEDNWHEEVSAQLLQFANRLDTAVAGADSAVAGADSAVGESRPEAATFHSGERAAEAQTPR